MFLAIHNGFSGDTPLLVAGKHQLVHTQNAQAPASNAYEKDLENHEELLDILLDSLRLNMTKHKHACFQQKQYNYFTTSAIVFMEIMIPSKYAKTQKPSNQRLEPHRSPAEPPAFNGDKGRPSR